MLPTSGCVESDGRLASRVSGPPDGWLSGRQPMRTSEPERAPGNTARLLLVIYRAAGTSGRQWAMDRQHLRALPTQSVSGRRSDLEPTSPPGNL